MSPDPSQDAAPDWDRVAADADFRRLLLSKVLFLAPATAFFMLYYFALPVLAGFAPDLMNRKVLGNVDFAYLFALSQFAMAWILAGIYVLMARRWDRTAAVIVHKFERNR